LKRKYENQIKGMLWKSQKIHLQQISTQL
jgi:hypothetical protein